MFYNLLGHKIITFYFIGKKKVIIFEVFSYNNSAYIALFQTKFMIFAFYRNTYPKLITLNYINKNISTVKLREKVGFEIVFESINSAWVINGYVVVAGSRRLGWRH